MGVERNIVAIELGSSAIRGIIGQRRSDGSLQVLGYEKESLPDSIRKGAIYNFDKTVAAITAVKSRLEERQKVFINRVYVGLAGQSLRTVGNSVTRNLDVRVAISEEIVDRLKDENLAKNYGDAEILDVVPQEYRVGGRSTNDPVGIMADRIEGLYKNIISRRTLREGIQRVMQMAKLEIADFFISPLLLGGYLLSDTEKRSGCALIDFGAETTTVAVYEKNILRHLVVIPLGGNNITSDIAAKLHIDFDEAEQLKLRHGSAWTDEASMDATPTIDITGNQKVSKRQILSIIEARQHEILENVWEQLRGFTERLMSGIVFTGGAANIKNLDTALKELHGYDKTKLRLKPASDDFTTSLKLDYQNNNLSLLLAMLRRGDMACTSEKPLEPGLFDQQEEAPDTSIPTADAQKADGAVITPHTTDETNAPNISDASADDKDDTDDKEPQKPKGPGIFTRFSEGFKRIASILVDPDETQP